MTPIIPTELRELIELHRSQQRQSFELWRDKSGSLTENAARIEESDRFNSKAKGTLRRIREFCEEHSISTDDIQELLR